MKSRSAPANPGQRALAAPIVAVVFLGLASRGAWLAAAHRMPLSFVHGTSFTLLAVALLAAVGVTALTTWRSAEDLRSGTHRPRPLAPLRHAFTALTLGWLAFLALAQPFQRLHFDMALGLVGGGWAVAILIGRSLHRRRPDRSRAGLRGLDLALFGLCLAALTGELTLRGYASARPSPLFARVGVGPAELLERFRSQPGELRFGFPCNSRGYYDGEFLRKDADSDQRLIVSIGDSFSVGAVPHALHYTTLLEDLTGDTVYNMGVAGIGPPEYASLVALEAAPLAPDAILIAIFIGNDLDVPDIAAELPDPLLRSWWQREQVLLFVVPQRLARIRQERERLADVARVQGEHTTPAAPDRDAVEEAFPWTVDPTLEEGTLSEAAHLRLETQRALAACAPTPASFDLLCRSLLEAKRAAGDVPLSVMLIPDEFQVDDALWEQVQIGAGRGLDRDRPQALLNAWLTEQGIPHLDLLPILRAVPRLEDGRRHLYHARDTHWNARGNRVAAEALAGFLREPRP